MKAITKSNEMVELVRGQGVFQDESEGRVYVPEHALPNAETEYQYPSTTTVKGELGSIEKKHRINRWQGQQIDADESLKFYQARGEIAHEYTYKYISEQLGLDDYKMDLELPNEKLEEISYTPVYRDYNTITLDGTTHEINSIDDLITLDLLQEHERPSTTDAETQYGYISGVLSGVRMAKQLLRDIKEVVYIEQYIINDTVGYAGQFDLLYVSKEDNLVLTDLKTSSNIHFGYRTQLSAYYNALPREEITQEVEEKYNITVDEWFMQVVRHNHEQQIDQVETNKSWSKDHSYHYTKFKEQAEKMREEKLPATNIDIS